jgi:hypothetical protein
MRAPTRPVRHQRREQGAELEHDAAANEQTEHRELYAGEQLVERLERCDGAEESGDDDDERHRSRRRCSASA